MNKKPGMDGKHESRRFSIANVAIGTVLGLTIPAVYMFTAGHVDPRPNRSKYALATAIAIESAVINFQTEYGALPDAASHVTTDSSEGINLLSILLGLEPQIQKPQNTRGIKLLYVKEGKDRKNGLIYSESGTSIEGLFDPWGNPYTIELDTQNAGHLHFTIGNKTIELKNRRVAAYSPGPDGKLGTKDDVITW